jgi:hypothetical protein
LIRDIDVKDRPQDQGSFSGSDSKRDVESENKAEYIRRVMDFREIDIRFIRSRMTEFTGFEMVLPVLIAEFKLRAKFFLDKAFSRIKLIESLNAMGAVIVTAFINSNLFTFLPLKECMMAIRAEVFGFIVFTESLVKLKQVITDLASKLRPFIAVIVVDIDVRSIAERTESLLRDFGGIRAVFNRRKRFTVSSLVLSQQEFVILWLRGLHSNGRLS